MDSGITFVEGGAGITLDARNTLDVGDKVGNDTAQTDIQTNTKCIVLSTAILHQPEGVGTR